MKTHRIRMILAAMACVIFAATLHAQVPNLINYQGRVAVSGTNFNGSGQFAFALVNSNGTTTYWSNDGASSAGSQPAAAVTLTVTNGLYSLGLGDTTITNMTAIPYSVFSSSSVYLRVWFNDGTHGWQLLTPDQRIAAAGYAMTAATLPAGSVTSADIASGAVGTPQLAAGAFAEPLSVSGSAQKAAANTAYAATSASDTVFTLPSSANVGDEVEITGEGTGGWSVGVGTGEWTQQTGGLPASAQWKCVASSADGTHLVVVVYGGGIYTSANSGVTWTPQSSGLPTNTAWQCVASSTDGTHLAAVVFGGGIYTSTNSGASWTQQTSGLPSNPLWWAVASSADGTHLVAVVSQGGGIYTSTNSAATWTQQSSGLPTNTSNWASVASSSDGTHLVAVDYGGGIYTSTNSGATWTQQTSGLPSNPLWWAVASSADGTHLVAVVSAGGIYTSTNSGATWTQQTSGLPTNPIWYSVASSADGTHLAAVAYGGGIYSSTNSGSTWTQSSAPTAYWQSVASSADGTQLVAGIYGGGIYTNGLSGAQGTTATLQYLGNGVWATVQPDGPWLFNGSSIFYDAGNVGIGTNSPESGLSIVLANAGGRGGEVSIVNNATSTVGNEAALNFGTDPTTYNADNPNAQIKARLMNTNDATDMVFSTWNGSSWGERMRIQAGGNVGIGTSTPAYPLQVGNAYCTAGGVWTNASDRNLKEDFTAIAPGDVLAKVAAMPITQWKYKVEPNGIKHIGPVAQDFHAAFGLGDSDKAIGSVDESGVALAAIQGLNQKLEEQNARLQGENTSMKQELARQAVRDKALDTRLSRLEQAVGAKPAASEPAAPQSASPGDQ